MCMRDVEPLLGCGCACGVCTWIACVCDPRMGIRWIDNECNVCDDWW